MERTADVKHNLPHVLSKPEDSMIIVGAVDETGDVFSDMSKDSEGLVHVYSPGTNIRAPTDATHSVTSSGTSHAAAVVVRRVLHRFTNLTTNFVVVGPHSILQRSTEPADHGGCPTWW